MPWYGMHLIERLRNQALETERQQRTPNALGLDEPSRTSQLIAAMPVLVVVTLWGVASAALFSFVADTSPFDAILAIVSVPLVMALAGAAWAERKSEFSSGLSAAVVTGAVMGVVFLVGIVL